jgi:hypothetical protein
MMKQVFFRLPDRAFDRDAVKELFVAMETAHLS